MKLKKLQKEWVSSSDNSELQAQIWNRAAMDYANKPIPDFESNPFLHLLNEKQLIKPDAMVLDIGCGAGLYSLALASRVKGAVGIDVSPLMVEYGQERAKSMALSNVTLSHLDWATANVDSLGFRSAFDLVFAHMTPAICDYATFDNMNLCSKAYCAMVKPARRRDVVQDAAFALIGIEGQAAHFEDTIVNAFSYLWEKGCCPELSYRQECWHFTKSLEDMAAWCIDRARLHKKLSTRDEEMISNYLQGISENGMVTETVTTTIVTMLWHV